MGQGDDGELAQNNRTNYSSPVQIPGTTWGTDIVGKVAGSGDGTGWIKTDGTLWTWGHNGQGRLGTNQAPAQLTAASSPVQVPGTTWDMVGNAMWSKTAIKTDGTMWSWGENEKGLLGLNQPESTDISSPTQIPGTNWKYIASGAGRHNLAIRTDGTLWGWGRADYGNLATAPGTDG